MVVPLEESPVLPSKETSSENLKDQLNLEKTSPQELDLNAPLKDNQKPVITVKEKPEQKSSNNTHEQKTYISTKKHFTSEKQANKKEKRPLKPLIKNKFKVFGLIRTFFCLL